MLKYVLPVLIIMILSLSLTRLYNWYIRRRFLKKYLRKSEFKKIPGNIHIYYKKRKQSEKNYYKLKFPYWKFHNKDGSRDKRRNDNEIIYPESELYVDKYKIVFDSPVDAIVFVNALRMQGVIISQNKLEKQKEKKILKQKENNLVSGNIGNIIEIFSLNPYEFEKYCVHLYQKMGIQASYTPAVKDGGYDIKLRYKNGERGIVECKCYNSNHKVGRPAIQKLVGANQTVQAEHMAFITTSSFSQDAVNYAKETDVELIDGEQLSLMIGAFLEPSESILFVSEKEWALSKKDLKPLVPADIYKKL